MRDLIKRLKYDADLAAAPLLADLLVEYLHRHLDPTSIDLIVPNPTHPGRGIRHTESILNAAAGVAGHRWRFDDPASPCLVKIQPTPRSHGGDRNAAADALLGALTVARPELVKGRRILIVDDVATTGAQIEAVARTLTDRGAIEVSAVVLASPQPRGRAGGTGTAPPGDSVHGVRVQLRPGAVAVDGPQPGGECLDGAGPANDRSLAMAKQTLAARLDRLQQRPQAQHVGLGR